MSILFQNIRQYTIEFQKDTKKLEMEITEGDMCFWA